MERSGDCCFWREVIQTLLHKILTQSPFCWTGNVSVDFPGLAQSTEQAGHALPWALFLKCPHVETSWHRTGMGLSKHYLSLWFIPGPVLIMGTLAQLWGKVGEVEEWPQWMFPGWAPAFSPQVSPGDPFTCCYSCVGTGTLLLAASLVLVKFSEGFWKSCWLLVAFDWGETFALAQACSCLFKTEPRTPCRGESKLAQCLSAGLAIEIGRVKNVTAHLASTYPRLGSVRIQ